MSHSCHDRDVRWCWSPQSGWHRTGHPDVAVDVIFAEVDEDSFAEDEPGCITMDSACSAMLGTLRLREYSAMADAVIGAIEERLEGNLPLGLVASTHLGQALWSWTLFSRDDDAGVANDDAWDQLHDVCAAFPVRPEGDGKTLARFFDNLSRIAEAAAP